MFHAFDFDWPNVILKEYSSREQAQKDSAYGSIYAALFRLDNMTPACMTSLV